MKTWRLQTAFGVRELEEGLLLQALEEQRLTGLEWVRVRDGSFGPIFGQPLFCRLVPDRVTPRVYAELRAHEKIGTLQRRVYWSLAGLVFAVVLTWAISTWIAPVVVGLTLVIAWWRWKIGELYWLLQKTTTVCDLAPIQSPPPIGVQQSGGVIRRPDRRK